MLFGLETDTGDRVTVYVVPDNYASVPTIRVCSGGADVRLFAANEMRESLVSAGRHESGRCGFSISTEDIPELREMTDLEIYDAETGILVYRRPPPAVVRKKLLRIEFSLFPLWQLDRALGDSFQYFAKGVENFDRETTTQLFLLNQINSIYLSGRILYRNYTSYIEPNFQTVILIQDPYHELAERLLVLSKMRKLGSAHFGLRENAGLSAAMEFAEQLVANGLLTGDARALAQALRRMPDDVAATLANPFTRQLTCSTPDEMPTSGAIASALQLLSTFAVVGLRHELDNFVNTVAELVRVKPESLPIPPKFSAVPPLAQLLVNTREVDFILEKDLELYHSVIEACDKLATSNPAR